MLRRGYLNISKLSFAILRSAEANYAAFPHRKAYNNYITYANWNRNRLPAVMSFTLNPLMPLI